VETPDLLIVGAGPAGSALALFLARRAPELARRTVVVEKRRHPRHKVCAGGLIPHTLDCLAELGIELSVPHVVVDRATVRIPGRSIDYDDRRLCAVVRRNEFDALLAGAARSRGVEIREQEKVVAIERDGGGLRVRTERGELRPKVVVGADGSGSIVRRALLAAGHEAIGRAVMCDLPAADGAAQMVGRDRYAFDFRAVPRGLRGYLWEFPCWIDGAPFVNLGAYALDRGGETPLPGLVRERARELGFDSVRLEAFPIRWYHHAEPLSAPGALVIGDAAGCDPLMGEGISFAFEYARLAAGEIATAFSTGDFAFAGYSARVRGSWFGRKLRRLGTVARMFYGGGSSLSFALASRSRRLQDVGIRWYNGVDGWDRQSGWRAAARLLAGGA
jgi:flavin-dependent dehydrogenase